MFKSENNQITIEQVRKLDEEYTLVDIEMKFRLNTVTLTVQRIFRLQKSKGIIHFCQKTSLLFSVAKAVR